MFEDFSGNRAQEKPTDKKYYACHMFAMSGLKV
jgi:hypothetical protein